MHDSLPPLIAPQGVSSTSIYEKLRLAIVSGELRPNEPLIEDDLAAKLGTSRTPLREGIQRLSADGLLVRRKRGWAVREFTSDEIRENYEVRAGLEGLAARLAAERGTDEERAAVWELHEQRSKLRIVEPAKRMTTNRDFHSAILAAAHNERLRHQIFMAGNFYLTRRVALAANEGQYERAQQEHERIARAILSRKADEADQEMRLHIMNAFQTWLQFHADC